MEKEDRTELLWEQVKEKIRDQVNDQSFLTWFAPTVQESLEEGVLTVSVPNKFFKDWLTENYQKIVEEAASSIAASKCTVAFQIKEHKKKSKGKEDSRQLSLPKVRNLQQGKALADALWLRASQGQDFFELAAQNTEDNEFIKRNRGVVPFPIRENTPGYELTWRHANELKPGEMSRPFFDAGRGYVIVKMMNRIPSRGFEAEIETIRKDAAEQQYGSWRFKTVREAKKNQNLFGDR